MNAAPVYPLPRPADTDNRFSLGLALDIAAVLTRHGYPPITAGADLIRLHQAIFGLIYQHNNANDQPLDIPSSIGNQIPSAPITRRAGYARSDWSTVHPGASRSLDPASYPTKNPGRDEQDQAEDEQPEQALDRKAEYDQDQPNHE